MEVATTTAPTCSGSMPLAARALRPEAIAIARTDSSAFAKRRFLMPERDWIHSSVESIVSQISALLTTRSGR